MNLPQRQRLVRIVRDIRDATRASDYFIPETRADELYIAGLLTLTKVRGAFGAASDTWAYAARNNRVARWAKSHRTALHATNTPDSPEATKALGALADVETRELRQRVHVLLDARWRNEPRRSEARRIIRCGDVSPGN